VNALLISTVVMFQDQNRETINSTVLKKFLCPSRSLRWRARKTVFHNTTPDLQDQDRLFWSETGLLVRPTVSDHITAAYVWPGTVTHFVLRCRVGHGSLFQNPTQPKISGPNPTQPNPQKSSPDPTQPIIDTWYGVLDYTENFIQQLLLHVIDK